MPFLLNLTAEECKDRMGEFEREVVTRLLNKNDWTEMNPDTMIERMFSKLNELADGGKVKGNEIHGHGTQQEINTLLKAVCNLEDNELSGMEHSGRFKAYETLRFWPPTTLADLNSRLALDVETDTPMTSGDPPAAAPSDIRESSGEQVDTVMDDSEGLVTTADSLSIGDSNSNDFVAKKVSKVNSAVRSKMMDLLRGYTDDPVDIDKLLRLLHERLHALSVGKSESDAADGIYGSLLRAGESGEVAGDYEWCVEILIEHFCELQLVDSSALPFKARELLCKWPNCFPDKDVEAKHINNQYFPPRDHDLWGTGQRMHGVGVSMGKASKKKDAKGKAEQQWHLCSDNRACKAVNPCQYGHNNLEPGEWFYSMMCVKAKGGMFEHQHGISAEVQRELSLDSPIIHLHAVLLSDHNADDKPGNKDYGEYFHYARLRSSDKSNSHNLKTHALYQAAVSLQKKPVRVFRNQGKPHGPAKGVRYDGLYYVESYNVTYQGTANEEVFFKFVRLQENGAFWAGGPKHDEYKQNSLAHCKSSAKDVQEKDYNTIQSQLIDASKRPWESS